MSLIIVATHERASSDLVSFAMREAASQPTAFALGLEAIVIGQFDASMVLPETIDASGVLWGCSVACMSIKRVSKAAKLEDNGDDAVVMTIDFVLDDRAAIIEEGEPTLDITNCMLNPGAGH